MGAHRVTKPVFLHTNQEEFQSTHYCCFPYLENLNGQVKRKSKFTGTESIPIENALGREDRRLHVDALNSSEVIVPLENKRFKDEGMKKKDSVDEYRQSMIEEYSSGNKEECGQLACEKCGSGGNEDEMVLCNHCKKGFHLNCLSPVIVCIPNGIWYCRICLPRLPRMPEKTTFTHAEIKEFFGIKNCSELIDKFGIKNCSELMERVASAKGSRKRRRRASGTLFYQKKKRELLPYVPAEDASQRLKQMASLASAMMKLNILFSPELTYIPGMAPRSANEPKFENGGMQKLSRKDQNTLNLIRSMGKIGFFPPLVLVYDTDEGYTVEADGSIKDLTIVAEYAGDVDYWTNRVQDDCDSLMTLLTAQDTSKSLVICPDKRGNIARFISGINNHLLDSKKKLNLKCVRYDVNGECRALLVAIRDIVKGERLYYDYNAYEYEYPTHNFR